MRIETEELELFRAGDVELPVVDFTPSLVVSSMVFYQGDAFPEWKNDVLVGTFKSRELFHCSLEENRVIEQEILLDNFARVKDIEAGANGEVYLLLENAEGSSIAARVSRNSMSRKNYPNFLNNSDRILLRLNTNFLMKQPHHV